MTKPKRKSDNLVDLSDLLAKTYRHLDAQLDRDLPLKDLVLIARAVAYLKGTSTKPPPLRRPGKGVLEGALTE